ncbi:hypothetical protein Tco_0794606 [Tanacetum coccineum]
MGTVSDVIAGGTEGAVQQGSQTIYSLINHYTDAKDIWENVKMILEGSELTKDDRESQLYDEFEHFRQNKGETIQGYYVRTQRYGSRREVVVQEVQWKINADYHGRPFIDNNARGNVVAGNVVSSEQRRLVTHTLMMMLHDSHENDFWHIQCGHVFEADEFDAFDSDVDVASTIHRTCSWQISLMKIKSTMSLAINMTRRILLRYNIMILVDNMDVYHEYTRCNSDYVEDTKNNVATCNVSSVRNDALMFILDEMHEQGVQSRLANKPDIVVNDSVTLELRGY